MKNERRTFQKRIMILLVGLILVLVITTQVLTTQVQGKEKTVIYLKDSAEVRGASISLGEIAEIWTGNKELLRFGKLDIFKM